MKSFQLCRSSVQTGDKVELHSLLQSTLSPKLNTFNSVDKADDFCRKNVAQMSNVLSTLLQSNSTKSRPCRIWLRRQSVPGLNDKTGFYLRRSFQGYVAKTHIYTCHGTEDHTVVECFLCDFYLGLVSTSSDDGPTSPSELKLMRYRWRTDRYTTFKFDF